MLKKHERGAAKKDRARLGATFDLVQKVNDYARSKNSLIAAQDY